MYFFFDQNNPNGVTLQDAERGIGHFVIIEADSANAANAKADSIGLYFDGVSEGMDCECCGDRWNRVVDYDAREVLTVYGQELDPEERVLEAVWFGGRATGYLHRANGSVAEVHCRCLDADN